MPLGSPCFRCVKKKDDVSKKLSPGCDIDHQFGRLLLSGERKASMNWSLPNKMKLGNMYQSRSGWLQVCSDEQRSLKSLFERKQTKKLWETWTTWRKWVSFTMLQSKILRHCLNTCDSRQPNSPGWLKFHHVGPSRRTSDHGNALV